MIQIRLIGNRLQLTKFQIFQRAIVNFNGTAMVIYHKLMVILNEALFNSWFCSILSLMYQQKQYIFLKNCTNLEFL